MSEQSWKYGDAALVTCSDGKERIALYGTRWIDDSKVWLFPDKTLRDVDNSVARPLVVIDPENREQVERLVRAFWHAQHPDDGGSSDYAYMTAALREFANPKPPKPTEPTGLGAVIEDDAGRIYTRYETSAEPQPWWQSAHGPEHDVVRRFSWSDIDAVKVLSEGVIA